MNKYTQKDFKESTSLKKIWNRIITWHEFKLATVMWDKNPWKIVHEGVTFDQLTHTVPAKSTLKSFPDLIFNEKTYTPIAEFHTQAELWNYIKNYE